jgi:serine/threonine protein kinase
MDSVAAKRLIDDLTGNTVGGWKILGHLGTGKSAVVFRASRNSEERALKVFDPDLVQRAGRDRQLKRIKRELSLRDKIHPNLVRVFDGGECPDTGYFFIVMDLIDAPNLAEVLMDVPRESIRAIIAQVADAAHFLETLTPHIAHRDIKPDNIAISRDFSHATLLDLGVILPIDLAEKDPSSDGERRFFVGTLRYSPPEFLVRREEHTVDGWRAISFYQLGAHAYESNFGD